MTVKINEVTYQGASQSPKYPKKFLDNLSGNLHQLNH